MLRYATTIFLSAFLLFQVQPMIARFILPWFGGTAAVWTTCMMFFQITLLLGYAYAHVMRLCFSPRIAWLIHVAMLATAACFAHIIPPESMKPVGGENLTIAVVMVLAVTIGLPFFVLSTTGPLVQAWQSTSHHGRSPYRLYALSNLGSMLALLSYPFLIERYLPMAQQARVWSIGFLVFAGLCCWSGWQTMRYEKWDADSVDNLPKDKTFTGIEATNNSTDVGWLRPLTWVLLAMTASVMLLATTNLMCQEVASVPFLWILPLSLYLLSFIICFDRPALYRRRIFTPLLVITAFVAVALVHLNVFAGLLLQVAGLAAVGFSASMVCHGELERLKPDVRHLTWFYLLIAVGGSLGGIFVAVVAPHLFTGFFEFHFALLVCLLVPLAILIIDFRKGTGQKRTGKAIPKWAAWTMGTGIMLAATFTVCSLVYFLSPSYQPGVVFKARNEYGLVSVIDRKSYRAFINGSIDHGGQYSAPERALDHNSYYVSGSGIAIATESFRNYLAAKNIHRGLHVGILGLGAGGMMTWGEKDDKFVFYEINPLVKMIANNYFTYLSKGLADSEVVLGDGRVQLQRHAEKGGDKYDLIFMDAFASDSIPIHLITSECFEIYRENLTQDGVLIAHISNRFIDLQPVIYQSAIDLGMTPILINHKSPTNEMKTRWVLVTRNQDIIQSEFIKNCQSEWPTNMKPVRWTDDHASLTSLLDWSGSVDWKILDLHRK